MSERIALWLAVGALFFSNVLAWRLNVEARKVYDDNTAQLRNVFADRIQQEFRKIDVELRRTLALAGVRLRPQEFPGRPGNQGRQP